METPDLTSARFWESDDNHIATDPLRPDDADGLAEFARETLDARGWCFFQTSGSEGLPKWVGLTKEAFLVSARAVNAFFNATADDRWLVALPIHHVGGFAIHARCFAAGSSMRRMDGEWSPSAFAAQCAEQRVTLTSLVPTQVFDLASQRIAAPSWLRAVIVGGGALSAVLREQVMSLGWPICCSYGMTEAASQIATQSADAAAVTAEEMEVLPHWEVATDADGVLTVRGPALAKGYASRSKEGSWQWQAIDGAVGLRTRDRVRIRLLGARRLLQFVGRESAFIKICGELVNRDALQRRLDHVAEQIHFPTSAFVVPLDDPRRGTTLVIAVERNRSSPESRAILRECFNAECLPFERAAELREVPVIPRTSLGKARITELTKMLGEPCSAPN